MMVGNQYRRRVGAACIAVAVLASLLQAGCAGSSQELGAVPPGVGVIGSGSPPVKPPPTIDASKISARDDIVRIHSYWGDYPWLTDSDQRPFGLKARVYFVDIETERGSFVAGTIAAEMYLLTRTRDGRRHRELLHEWRFDTDQAMGYRIRRKAVTGYSYGLVLPWPEHVDVVGRQIELVFRYDRTDGRVIKSSPKRFRVPVPPGFRAAARRGG